MKSQYIIINLLLAIVLNGCFLISSGPEIQLINEFNGDGIAVLNFSVKGNYISSDIGQIAADKFTDALFISNNFKVIDRSCVNDATNVLEIKSSEILSNDDIQKLGQKLNANFIVLGRVQQVSKSDFYNSDKQLYISFRIISVKDFEVVGAGTYSDEYDDDLIEKVQSMVYKLAGKIEIE